MLSNLAALSIHGSKTRLQISKLCDWLNCCDLKLFQIDEQLQLDSLSRPDTELLLRCLWRHRNLQALALMMRRSDNSTGRICIYAENEKGATSWPKLMALYLAAVDQH